MEINFFTIVLDGMPWITHHLPVFEKLNFPWQWWVMEGVSAPENCTSWCAPIAPRLSNDGTTGYLDSINDPRVIVIRNEYWHGKIAMCNAPLRYLYRSSLLWQIDSDEIWTPEQICTVREMFIKEPTKNCAYFFCNYYVGRGLRIANRDCYGNNSYEWCRVWRWTRGLFFKTHEPPKLDIITENAFTREETEAAGCVFRHEAYSTEKQVRFKEEYYGSKANPAGEKYKKAVDGWFRLQRNLKFPVKLQTYLPWVDEKALVEKVG